MNTESGEIAILFTDIEGSTKLWEESPDQMSLALSRHDAEARQAVHGNGGVIVKTTGDGMYAAFDDPFNALNAIIALQQSLADRDATAGIQLKLRGGLHFGTVERRDNDFFGPPVNRTARIMGVAHGGQILVSQALADRLAARLPDGVSLRDLGGVRLKDLAEPERLYQVIHPELRQDFPALRSLEATPNNLPQQLTSFFGREREIEETKVLLRKVRLLTLLGMGGLGKTRLSLQIAADELDGYPDGVWFLDLAPIRDAALIPHVAAHCLHLQEEPGRPVIDTLCAHLKQRTLLLIMDNCEHLIRECAEFANLLLRTAPGLRILATSREALRVPGEQVYALFPLAVPPRSADLETLAKADSVQLFLDRVRLQRADFALTEKEAPAVIALCERLEGIPLALELAAARMRTLTITEINRRLSDRFKLLTGGGRVLLERQQTLRALVDWSYDLLSDSERVLFARLAVFAGGFELAAAEQIAGAEPLQPDDVLDLLTLLIDKSLLRSDESSDGMRYRMLETLRDYARERLIERGEMTATAVRHCEFYLDVAKAANHALHGAEQATWTERLQTELDNLRAAIVLTLEGGADPILSVKFECALMNFWILRGYLSEGRRYVQGSLALPAVQSLDIAHAHALYVGAALANCQGDYASARRMLEACLALRRRLGNPGELAATLSTLAHVRLHEGDAEGARADEEEALTIFRDIGNRLGEACTLLNVAQRSLDLEDYAAGRRYLEECSRLAEQMEYSDIMSACERGFGDLALEAGDPVEARKHFARSLAICRKSGNRRYEAISLYCLGKADLVAGALDLAHERLSTALELFKAFEMDEYLLDGAECFGDFLHQRGAPEVAVRLYAATESRRRKLALVRPPRSARRWQALLAAARDALGDSFDAHWKAGEARAIEDAIAEALRAGEPEVRIQRASV